MEVTPNEDKNMQSDTEDPQSLVTKAVNKLVHIKLKKDYKQEHKNNKPILEDDNKEENKATTLESGGSGSMMDHDCDGIQSNENEHLSSGNRTENNNILHEEKNLKMCSDNNIVDVKAVSL